MIAPRSRGASSPPASRRTSPPDPSSSATCGPRRSRSLRSCDRPLDWLPHAAAAWLTALVVVVSLCAGGNALAQTLNPDGSQTIWEADLTVSVDSEFVIGYDSINGDGSLVPDSLTYMGTSMYADIFGLEYGGSSCSGTTFAIFSTRGGDWRKAEGSWVLLLQEGSAAPVRLPFSTAHRDSNEVDFCGASVDDLDWSDGDEVDVKIIRVAIPTVPRDAEAVEHGTGVWRLSWTEPATTGGWVEYQYRYHSGDGMWSDWTDVPDSGPGGANASEYTVGALAGGVQALELRAANGAGESPAAAATVAANPFVFVGVPGSRIGPDGEETVWTARMRVYGDTSYGGGAGFYERPDQDLRQGRLDPSSFTYGGRSFTVNHIGIERNTTTCDDRIGFNILSLGEAAWDSVGSSGVLLLQEGTATPYALPFSDAAFIRHSEITWCGVTAADLGWSRLDMIDVEVFIVNRAPGAPRYAVAESEGDGSRWELSWRVPVETGRWLEYQYRRRLVNGQWTAWTDIPESGTGRANASGYTVTGLTPGVVPAFELRGRNGAGAGPAVAMVQTLNGLTAPLARAGRRAELRATPGRGRLDGAVAGRADGGRGDRPRERARARL